MYICHVLSSWVIVWAFDGYPIRGPYHGSDGTVWIIIPASVNHDDQPYQSYGEYQPYWLRWLSAIVRVSFAPPQFLFHGYRRYRPIRLWHTSPGREKHRDRIPMWWLVNSYSQSWSPDRIIITHLIPSKATPSSWLIMNLSNPGD